MFSSLFEANQHGVIDQYDGPCSAPYLKPISMVLQINMTAYVQLPTLRLPLRISVEREWATGGFGTRDYTCSQLVAGELRGELQGTSVHVYLSGRAESSG